MDKSKSRYLCSICNKHHEYQTVVEILKPDLLCKMTLKELKEAEIHKDYFYLIDKSFVLSKANLIIPVLETNFTVTFEIWINITLEEFLKINKSLQNDTISIVATTYEQIPFYSDSDNLDLIVTYEFEGVIKYPKVTRILTDHEMNTDFSNGLDYSKYIKWLKKYYHSELAKNKPTPV